MPLIIISNPVCGSGNGHTFVKEQVIPLLEGSGRKVDHITVTDGPQHAGVALIDFMKQNEGSLTVILSSGDGTLHEIINAITYNHENRQGTLANTARLIKITFVLVPSGTANALYSTLFPPSTFEDIQSIAYRLKSVQSFLDMSRKVPLSLAITSLQGPTSHNSVISVVVASTALHASILHDSEDLRKEIPDLSRFKVAAANNITRWYKSRVTFLPSPSGRVEVYDVHKKTFALLTGNADVALAAEMCGPFQYFLSTVNVDRLESAFEITPLQSSIRPELGTMDVVVVRPMRDKSLSGSSEEDRKKFAEKAGTVLGGAYQEGAHVNMQYSSDGQITFGGEGEPVVEYVRCGGWEWVPEPTDEAAHLLCADGTIFQIENGGRATCKIVCSVESTAFDVYA